MQAFSSKYTAYEIEKILDKACKLFNTITVGKANYGTFKLKRHIKNYNGYIPKNEPAYGTTILPEVPTALMIAEEEPLVIGIDESSFINMTIEE